jgi:plastocyanin
MRRSVTFTIGLALVVGALVLGESTLSATTTPPPVKKVAIASFSQCANGYFCFKPANVTVKKGTKVVWTNTTTFGHTVTRCTKAACGIGGGTGKQLKLGSPMIAPHKTYVFTFTGLGTYRYYCKVHGYGLMHGVVTVTS